MALTKEKLVARLQTQIGMTKPETRQVVKGLFEIMKGTLANGEDLLISGFGKFWVRQKKARRGRNPHIYPIMGQVSKFAQASRHNGHWPCR